MAADTSRGASLVQRLGAAGYDWLFDRVDPLGGADHRRRLVEQAAGKVLEVGAGTGRNLPLYRNATRVVALEPDPGMRARADQAAQAAQAAVEVVDGTAEDLPFPDATFDTVVASLVLCTVPDLAQTLAEARRVLRPGGTLRFYQHVRADNPRLARWQDRLERPWGWLAGGCHPNRDVVAAITAAGFRVLELDRFDFQIMPPLVRPHVLGVAQRSTYPAAAQRAALNDVAAWILLAVAIAVATPAGSLLAALRILGLAVLFSAAMALVVRRLVGRVSVAYDQAGRVPAGWVAAILVGVLLSAFVASWIGLAAIFGAFVMGLILPRRADLTQEVTRRLEDLVVTVLLPLFFVVTGLRVQLGLLDRPVLWLLTAALLGVAVAGKWLGATVAARYAGLRMRESMALGALMNSRGLTELIVVTVGLNYGVVSPALFTMLVLVALVTTFMAGPALRLIDPSRQLSVSPEEELQAAPTVRQANLDGHVAERSILIAPMDDQNLDALVAVAEPLARSQPPHGMMLARLLQPPQAATGGPIAGERELAAASSVLERRRDELAGRGIAARAMACISPDPGQDLVQLASLEEIDLVLVDGRRPLLGQGVPRGDPGPCLAKAPSDVACLVGPRGSVPDIGPDRPIAVPFEGAEHDWAALELAARIARAHGAPIRLLATTDEPRAGNRDATRLLADAALVVDQLTGVATQLVLVSPGGLATMAREAGLLVVGISGQWRVEGLGSIPSEIAHAIHGHVLFVRRGTRPGILAWPPLGRELPGPPPQQAPQRVHEGARVSLGQKPHA